jgi:hypothetical protein
VHPVTPLIRIWTPYSSTHSPTMKFLSRSRLPHPSRPPGIQECGS